MTQDVIDWFQNMVKRTKGTRGFGFQKTRSSFRKIAADEPTIVGAGDHTPRVHEPPPPNDQNNNAISLEEIFEEEKNQL